MASRIQSPKFNPNPNPNPFGSNDDDLERAQTRAARAARRRSAAFSPPPPPTRNRQQDQPFLGHDQIVDLFQNCIKLASENKINQKNTWELGIIDHLSEIVRVRSEDEDTETNFQKASCTLEAGVKIYSLRVDSVHSETYKVLGGINRAGYEGEEENVGDGEHTQTEQEENLAKKDLGRKLSPLATLESSFEALNVKKFDGAFTVDPLYHQTSAQFDEGGAKGLLLNNLGVYGGCRVIFDSFESPENNILSEPHNHNSELIDLSFAKEYLEQMIMHVLLEKYISPTLKDIVNQFDEDNRRPSEVFPVAQQPAFQEEIADYDYSEAEGNAFDGCESWGVDHNDHDDPSDSFPSTDANFMSHQDENGDYTVQDPIIDQKLEKIADFLSIGLGFTSKSNAWAGPDHWKYQKAKGTAQIPCSDNENESELARKKPNKKKAVADLDFTKSLDKEMPNIFAPPKNPKSLLLPVNRAPCNTTLPEDCHYRPESLVRLLMLPDVMCLGKKARKCSDETTEDDTSVPFASWDDENMGNDGDEFPSYNSDTEEPGTLVRPPRQVNKVDIQYDKVSKQVDVHALKNMLWSNIQESLQMSDAESGATVSLREVLHQFSTDSCPITCSREDISPHLFFICLLHLANEHCLSLHECPTLDELQIHIPLSALEK